MTVEELKTILEDPRLFPTSEVVIRVADFSQDFLDPDFEDGSVLESHVDCNGKRKLVLEPDEFLVRANARTKRRFAQTDRKFN